jgi:tyrosine-protein kinase Etk/Wzc
MDTKSITLLDFLEILLKRKWMIAAIFVIAAGTAAFYSLRVTPIYESSTTLRIETVWPEQSLLSDMYLLRQGNPIETEIEMIKSRSMSEQVVRNLNLNFKITEFPPHFQGKFQDLFISPNFPYGRYHLTVGDDSGIITLKTSSGTVLGEGLLGIPFTLEGLSFKLSFPNAQSGDQITFDIENPLNEARKLQGSISVRTTKAPNIIRISHVSSNPREAARMTNELARQYLEENLAFARGEARSAKEFIEEQVELAHENLNEAERELQVYKENEKFIMLDEDAKEKITTLAKFETEKEEMIMKQREASKRLKSLKNQLSGKGAYTQYKSVASIPTVSSNPVVQNLKTRLSELEVQRAQMLQKYTEAHPDVIELNSQILEIKRGLNEAIQEMLQSGPSSGDPIYRNLISGIITNEIEEEALEERIQALTSIIEKYSKGLETLPEKEIQLAGLTRKAQVGEAIYTMLLKNLEEARISEAMKIGNIRIIDPAIPSDYPIKPRKKLNTMMGGFLGLLVGLGLSFLLEFLDNSIKDSEEIERILKLPVLGVIPHIRSNRRAFSIRKEKEGDGIEKRLITQLAPKSAVAEAYRTLRTNLQFARAGNSCQTLVITSPFPGEGKSITSANVAITMAHMGSKTLLVSSDLRRPVLHKLFGKDRSPGLTEILIRKSTLQESILPTNIKNLFLLSTGPLPPNPAELLDSREMIELIEEMKRTFDVTLFDSPPILAVTDAALLGGRMDGVIMILQSETTDRRAAKEAKKLLDTARVKCLGTILNNVPMDRPYGRYGSRYYNYYYDEEEEIGKKFNWRSFWNKLSLKKSIQLFKTSTKSRGKS